MERAGDIRSFTVMGPKERAKIDHAVVKYVTRDLLPFHTVEKEGFVELVTELTKNRYEIAKRRYYTDAQREIEKEAIEKTKAVLRSIDYFSATIDVWKPDFVQKRILGITLHWTDDHFKFHSIPIGLIEHDERLGPLDAIRLEAYIYMSAS